MGRQTGDQSQLFYLFNLTATVQIDEPRRSLWKSGFN